MKKRLIITLSLVLLFLSGSVVFSQDYKDLSVFLGKWESVMKHYTERMSQCTDLDRLSSDCVELADSVTVYLPVMMNMPDKYPEIDASNPPDELKEIFANMEVATTKYTEMLNYLMKVANANPENEMYQKAYGKLNLAVYNAMR